LVITKQIAIIFNLKNNGSDRETQVLFSITGQGEALR